jgi:hypothetical protein
VARAADKWAKLGYRLESFQDDDFVFRNGEALQELVKNDLELLSHDCLDTTECLLRLVTYYRAEILKLHRLTAKDSSNPVVTRDPALVQKARESRPFLSDQAPS